MPGAPDAITEAVARGPQLRELVAAELVEVADRVRAEGSVRVRAHRRRDDLDGGDLAAALRRA
jgi:hypothetical protein